VSEDTKKMNPTRVQTFPTEEGYDVVHVGGKLIGHLYHDVGLGFFLEPNVDDWQVNDLLVGHPDKKTLMQRIRLHAKIINQSRIDMGNGFKIHELDLAGIGDGVTIYQGSDRTPATIVDRTVRTMTVQEDDWTIVSGSAHDGSAKYEFRPSIFGTVMTFRRGQRSYIPATYYDREAKTTKDWVWMHQGVWTLGLGRSKYRDPHI
jgi:hypothetical protein